LTYGLLLGCGAAQPSKEQMKAVRDGQNRLFQKIVSEGSFQIWKLRNTRRIEKGDDAEYRQSESEVQNKFLAAVKAMAKADFAMTSVARYGKQAIPLEFVKNTWRKLATIDTEQEDGGSRARTGQVGVLVGSGLT
ncbi:hypothetical protein BDZ89DRAFT_890723, partial [Hymenopellis radicata]